VALLRRGTLNEASGRGKSVGKCARQEASELAMVEVREVTTIAAPIERCFDLARSVEVHLAGNVHFGESAVAVGGVTSGLVELGQRVTWRARHLGVWQNLTSEITRMDRPKYFRDEMIQGAFKTMEHDHYFESKSANETLMTDVFRFAAPLGALGWIAETVVLRRYMTNLLRERNDAIKKIAESQEWQRYLIETPAPALSGSAGASA
jgi:ligand-binding SRPBCC domain-containing protein